MSDTKLKCPFCQQELEIWHTNRVRMYACPDLTCKGYYMSATKDIWQELITTRKALDTAIRALKYIADGNLGLSPAVEDFADKALEQIESITKAKEQQ